jgi:SpoU rRNA methylase family enzyme
MQPSEIEALFTRTDGTYLCARWGRPIAPIVFGVEDDTLSVVKGAFEVVCGIAGHSMAETDPELGSNVMVFFFREWDELLGVPDLDRLIDGLTPMVERLKGADANQYRVFRFDEQGAIKACFIFLRMDAALSDMPADTLALTQVVQSIVLWSDKAFAEKSPLGQLEDGRVVLRPDIAEVIRAVYTPILPAVAKDPSHALRVFARMKPAD